MCRRACHTAGPDSVDDARRTKLRWTAFGNADPTPDHWNCFHIERGCTCSSHGWLKRFPVSSERSHDLDRADPSLDPYAAAASGRFRLRPVARGSRVAVVGNDGTLTLQDAHSGDVVNSFTWRGGVTYRVQWSPDESRLLVCDDNSLRLAQADDGREIARIRFPAPLVRHVQPRSNPLACASRGTHSARVRRFADNVIAAIEADPAREAGVRADMVEIARCRGDKPVPLDRAAWKRVTPTDGIAAESELGRRRFPLAIDVLARTAFGLEQSGRVRGFVLGSALFGGA